MCSFKKRCKKLPCEIVILFGTFNHNKLNRDIIFVADTETEAKCEEIKDEKKIWFKDAFLDSKRKLKEKVHEELRRYQYLTNFFKFLYNIVMAWAMNVPFQIANLCCR